MGQEKILENESAILWFHTDSKIVHHELKKFIHGEDFKEVLLGGVDLIKKHGACKWLSDDRANTIVSKEDQEWGKQVWFPQAKNAGWKYWAIVKPEKIMGEIKMKELTAMYKKLGIESNMFTDIEEAKKWLKEQ